MHRFGGLLSVARSQGSKARLGRLGGVIAIGFGVHYEIQMPNKEILERKVVLGGGTAVLRRSGRTGDDHWKQPPRPCGG